MRRCGASQFGSSLDTPVDHARRARRVALVVLRARGGLCGTKEDGMARTPALLALLGTLLRSPDRARARDPYAGILGLQASRAAAAREGRRARAPRQSRDREGPRAPYRAPVRHRRVRDAGSPAASLARMLA